MQKLPERCAPTAAAFAGAAIDVNVAEQPARLALADKPLLAEWKPSYERGKWGTLHAVSSELGVAATLVYPWAIL